MSTTDVGNKLVGWLLAGTGTLLAYSAYKNRYPWDVLRDIQGPPFSVVNVGTVSDDGTTGDPNAVPTDGFYGPQSNTFNCNSSFATECVRVRQVANREIKPTLVPIKPAGMLDKDAAASFARISAKLGYEIPNEGNYRSYAYQAAQYNSSDNVTLADGGRRYGNPDKSLHVVGLAIDVNSNYANKPELVAAFSAEGWQRPRPVAEAWHWSYLVRG
jgi:hypothetical protein